MSVGYRAVGWNANKRRYDAWLVGSVALYLAGFVGASLVARPEATAETLVIRAFGSAAFLLLHVVLAIGPLCRLSARFLPLLYNRRHLGVTMFLVALVHGSLSLAQFHALGTRNPLVSLFVSELPGASARNVPFQVFGFAALAILFLMAATSHDFWLANLSAPTWKRLHMLVYFAYALLVAHVGFGVAQVESPLLFGAVGVGALGLVVLHLWAAAREARIDAAAEPDSTWVDWGTVADIPEGRARVRSLAGERVAVFKYDGKLSALSGVCQHQNGPLGEGRVLDGCITCPWHGYQYRPEDGASPAPFEEKVPTFRVRVRAGRVEVDPRPLPPGTRVEPARLSEPEVAGALALCESDEFYVGYLPDPARALMGFTRRVASLLSLAALACGVLFAVAQKPLGSGVFEFGTVRAFEGVVRARPVPHLELTLAGDPRSTDTGVSQYPLVAFGKRGVDDWVGAFDGARVRLTGTLVYRDGMTMVEVAGGSVENVPSSASEAPPSEPPTVELLGVQTLTGEVVDSKCYLGVMKPGSAKLHRACAINCIEGGVPPVLLVRDNAGRATYYLVVGADGRSMSAEILQYVAVPVRMSGAVERHGGLWVLKTEPVDWVVL